MDIDFTVPRLKVGVLTLQPSNTAHFTKPQVELPWRGVTVDIVKYMDWAITCPMLQLILIVCADLGLRVDGFAKDFDDFAMDPDDFG